MDLIDELGMGLSTYEKQKSIYDKICHLLNTFNQNYLMEL